MLATKRVVSVLMAAISVASATRQAVTLELTNRERERLAAGQEVIKPIVGAGRNNLYGGTSLILINASPEQCQAAIEDLSRYPEIFPMFVDARKVGELGDKIIVRMRQGTAVFSLIYHILVSRDPARHLTRFRLIKTLPHDIDEVSGFWRLFPQKDGRTLVAYAVTAKINLGALGLIDRVGHEIQLRLVGMPGHLKSWLETPGQSHGAD